jgi:hypothetical protein
VHFSLEELGQAFAGYYLLAGELAYPVFDFWLNCVAPYLPVSTPATRPVTIPATPSSSAPPTTPATPGNPVPTPPFFTLGGGSSG